MPEAFFQDYLAQYQPFKSYWNYEDGCILAACQRMYAVTGADCYAAFVLDYLSSRVEEDGSLPTYLTEAYSLDSYHCSKSLFFAAHLTGDLRYRRAISWQAAQIQHHPRTSSGFCWHKAIYPQQIWIDGLYMSVPFFAEYANLTHEAHWYPMIARRFAYVRRHMRTPDTGLYRHGLDEARVQIWADVHTGLSATNWLRGEGWLLMALVDTLTLLPVAQDALRYALAQMLREALDALLPYRAEDGLFWQVIDAPDAVGNYTETSGSCMVAYALLRGAALGILTEEYGRLGQSILDAVQKTKLREGKLCDICSAAGLGGASHRDGSLAYYLSEPISQNDPKGVGALMLAEAALQQWQLAQAERRAVV